MKKELDLWRFALTKLEHNEPHILLVVAESSGSSPGRPGFKMIVTENELMGSIGGGVMEVSLTKKAQNIIKGVEPKNKTELMEQVHKKNVPNSSGMICSGKQTVIQREITKNDLPTVQKIIKGLANRIPQKIRISNSFFEVVDFIPEGPNFYFEKKSLKDFLYEEKLGFNQNLFIIGGGHCALALSEIMSRLDFHISLFDDRPNLNTVDENRFAHSMTILRNYESIGKFVPPGISNYVVVMTIGYKSDEIVIRNLLEKDFKYFGVLGSEAKMKILLKNLEKKGFDKLRLAKIHTPIGLPINSHTPEEIAISIAAEIIAVKNLAI